MVNGKAVSMDRSSKLAMFELLATLFEDALRFAQIEGITTKQMRDLLTWVQLKRLVLDGRNQQEMMAVSGFTRKWIRQQLSRGLKLFEHTNPLELFVYRWALDGEFPDIMPIDRKYPSFVDLHDCYGGDFTIQSLLKLLSEREYIDVLDCKVSLNQNKKQETINLFQSGFLQLMLEENQERFNMESFISQWSSDTEFPDVLPMEGPHPSFESLCLRYKLVDIKKEVFDELLNQEIAKVRDDFLVLNKSRRVTLSNTADAIYSARASLSALSDTLFHNLTEIDFKRTERRLWSNTVPVSNKEELYKELNKANSEHQLRLLAILRQHQTMPLDENDYLMSGVGVGLYWFERQVY